MKIDEKLEEMQSKLIKVVMEANCHRKDDAIKMLEELGLNNELATKLLESYRNAEDAKQTAKNVWNSAWNSRSGIDYSTDIAKTQQKETETRAYFESLKEKGALQIVANTIAPSEINDETLNILYEQGLQEDQLTNPALKITFHYYCESRAKDNQRAEDLGQVTLLKSKLKEVEGKNADLRKSNESLLKAYKNLQVKFRERMDLAEKQYQTALTKIKTLKDKLEQLQKRGIFKTIGDKIIGIFGNKTESLPETTLELPDTLFQSKAEKMGIQELDAAEMFFIEQQGINLDSKDANNRKTSGEVQK